MPHLTNTTPTVYDTNTDQLIDFVRPTETPEAALQRLASYGTALAVLPYEEAQRRHETAHVTDPKRIDESHFHEMLNIMPPRDWRRDGYGESFKLSELVTGRIGSIFVQIDDRHFTFQDVVTTPHAECCARVLQSQAYQAGRTDDHAHLPSPEIDA